MQFRTGTDDDVGTLWALRTRCVRELCSSHYPPEVIAPWSASPPPVQYSRLLGQGGCVVAEDDRGNVLGFGVLDAEGNEIDALFVDPDRGGQGIGQVFIVEGLQPERDQRAHGGTVGALAGHAAIDEFQGFTTQLLRHLCHLLLQLFQCA